MKWIRRLFRLTLALIVAAFIAGALWLTQPVIGHDPILPLPETVEPARLQSTVRRLSIEFRPRDSRHPGEFSRGGRPQ